MLRRLSLVATVLVAVALPVTAADADANDSKAGPSAKDAKADSRPVPTFTNADIEKLPLPGDDAFTNADIKKLPAPGNAALPSLEDDADTTASSTRFVIIGTPAAEGDATPPTTDPTAAAESLRWVEQLLRQQTLTAQLGAAQRRVRQAEQQVAELQRGFRREGSAFSSRGGNTDQLFMRSVAGDDRADFDDVVRRAYAELAMARAELDRLLARSATAPAAASAGGSP